MWGGINTIYYITAVESIYTCGKGLNIHYYITAEESIYSSILSMLKVASGALSSQKHSSPYMNEVHSQ